MRPTKNSKAVLKVVACLLGAVAMRGQTPVNMGYGGIGDPASAPGTPASSYALSNLDQCELL